MLQACEVTFSDAATPTWILLIQNRIYFWRTHRQALAARLHARAQLSARLRVLSRFRLLSDSHRHVRTHTTATLTL